MAYSMDLRERVMALYDIGMGTSTIAKLMGCCPAWARRLKQRRRELGTIAPLVPVRPDQRIYDGADEQEIRCFIARKPDATLSEVAEELGKPVSLATVSRALVRLDLPRKKSRPTRASKIGRT